MEVVVFQHGHEVARELCESAEEASLIVDWWSDQEGAQCQVDDLSIDHRPDDISSPRWKISTKLRTALTRRPELYL